MRVRRAVGCGQSLFIAIGHRNIFCFFCAGARQELFGQTICVVVLDVAAVNQFDLRGHVALPAAFPARRGVMSDEQINRVFAAKLIEQPFIKRQQWRATLTTILIPVSVP